MRLNPLHAIDFYKAGHVHQYPVGTSMVYSNFTARSSRLANIPPHLFTGKIVFFGLQYFVKDFLINTWNEEFFHKPKALVMDSYRRRLDNALGKGAVDISHVEALHDLGYLPLCIRALPEGSQVPIGVPALTVYNTLPAFFWLTNYIETVLSNSLWKPVTSATVAYHYRKLLEEAALTTAGSSDFVKFQGHDFSARGMSGPYDAALSGAAHLTSFVGTDTVSAIDLLETYYGADSSREIVGVSCPATEHSVMCMGTVEGEVDTFRRLICQVYPNGIVSIVSDTWDFWKVITEYAAFLKPEILEREGKVVFRPDSGDPIKIICGDPEAPEGTPEHKGAVQCLWEIFGGKVNRLGYKELDLHIGLIYGDSITLFRADAIVRGLREKGFVSTNVVLGIGSYTYNYSTRDCFGFAVKSTYGEIDGHGIAIFKDPKTDSGTKKSAVGLIRVDNVGGEYVMRDRQTWESAQGGCLEVVFQDGHLYRPTTLGEIRNRLWG